jgi:hypothetical protein
MSNVADARMPQKVGFTVNHDNDQGGGCSSYFTVYTLQVNRGVTEVDPPPARRRTTTSRDAMPMATLGSAQPADVRRCSVIGDGEGEGDGVT